MARRRATFIGKSRCSALGPVLVILGAACGSESEPPAGRPSTGPPSIEERVAATRACDPPPEELQLTVYPGVDHNSWSRTYNLSAGHDVQAWFLKQAT